MMYLSPPKSCIFFLFFLFFTGLLFSQDKLSALSISSDLKENANAVIRDELISVQISASNKMTVTTKRIVTVLNKYGNSTIGAYQFYDDDRKIKKHSAIIYNAAGKEIKKFKQKDFNDRSAVSSNDLYSDNRVQYLDYTPQAYPYTVVYESEIQTGTTVFIMPWKPVSGYFVSVEKSAYSFSNPRDIPYRIVENNFEGFDVKKENIPNGFTYSIKNFPGYKKEYLSPDIDKFSPGLKIALNEFALVGVQGAATNWEEFGKWQYDNLLLGRDELPEATLVKIRSLTAGAKDDLEKAKIIYQYVQDNTRYISVQLGIGGWEPMPAADVDKLGYGDCKALTNYTKALLDSQKITSYYAVVFAGEERKDLDRDFASMQGNHVILNIPREDGDVWLECTNQTMPFNYLGDFTDNRNVLLIKPTGGEIVKTRAYSVEENLQETFSKITLDESGNFSAKITRKSIGVPYGNIYHIDRQPQDKQILYYKNSWGHLQNLEFEEIVFENNRDDREFTEVIALTGQKLTSKAGSRLLLPTNFFTTPTLNVPRNSERKQDFEIERGFSYKDVFEFRLPAGFETESIPKAEEIENEFGSYRVTVNNKDENGVKSIEVKREYIINEGLWPAEKYTAFRDFMNKINSLNNNKAVIVSAI